MTKKDMVTDPNNMDSADYKILKADFKLMIEAVKAYIGQPAKVYLRINKVKSIKFITLVKYNEILARWNIFVDTTKREPNYISINIPITPPVPPITGATVTVNSGESIQTAINNAKAGDIIAVNPGTYKGFSIGKQVTVEANGIVNINSGISINGTGGILRGFNVTCDYAISLSNTNDVSIIKNNITTLGQSNAIQNTGTNNNLLVESNTIIGGSDVYGNGMAFEGVTNNSAIKDNKISNTLHGILFDKASTGNVISGNTVIGNGLIANGAAGIDYQGVAIYTIQGSTNFKILNNVISGERDGIAIEDDNDVETANGFVLSGNICTANINGVWMTGQNVEISGNTFQNNINGIDITGNDFVITNNIITKNSNCDIASTTKAGQINKESGNTFDKSGGKFYVGGSKGQFIQG
jgi:parallel beta-helix repeat protein